MFAVLITMKSKDALYISVEGIDQHDFYQQKTLDCP